MHKPSGPRTEIIHWRGGPMEFSRSQGCGFNSTRVSKPPWYVVRYRGGAWHRTRWCYQWCDYGGPPMVFLTRKEAEKEAKRFRIQYGGGHQFGSPPLKVEVAKITMDGESY